MLAWLAFVVVVRAFASKQAKVFFFWLLFLELEEYRTPLCGRDRKPQQHRRRLKIHVDVDTCACHSHFSPPSTNLNKLFSLLLLCRGRVFFFANEFESITSSSDIHFAYLERFINIPFHILTSRYTTNDARMQ